jgi:hypothetical protein
MSGGPRKFSLFPKPLAQVIEPLTRPLFKSTGLSGTRLLTEWPQVIGPALARHTAPQKLSFPRGKNTGGTLTIAVAHGFATEIQHMQPIILERLATYLGYKAVTRLVISHDFLAEPAPAGQPKPQPTLPAASVALVQEVEDDELKEALTSLAETLSGKAT